MKRLLLIALVAACGDNFEASGSFEVVGHTDLGARGMNAALAIAGDTAYVGSRIDGKPIEIVDIADPAHPTVVGELGAPDEALGGMSSRELRAVGDLLVVLNLQCSPTLHGCAAAGAEPENLKFFDISNRRAPRLIGTYPVQGTRSMPRSPHEFFLWRDPKDPAHVLVYLAAPGVPSLEIIDASAGAMPTSLVRWDPYAQGGVTRGGTDNLLHSVSVNDAGTLAYLSHQTGGLYVLDLQSMMMLTPASAAPKFGAMGPHSAVQVPGRDILIVTEEIYPPPFGVGCPWGHLRTVDVTNPVQPIVVGEFGLPENDPRCAANAPMTAFTAHNATVTHDLALVTWYAGGLQAIDISDPAHPAQLAEFRPDALPSVDVEDPGLGGNKVEMWSYPVIDDGLIYVVDVRNGLYVLRYHGRWGTEIRDAGFAEGNSNL